MGQKGKRGTREERPRVEDWTVPVRECWTYWVAYGPHRSLCPSIPPFPAPPTRPHPFTDYTSITPDNTWLPLNAMYRMTERCALPFFDISVRVTVRVCSGLVMKKRGLNDERERGRRREAEHRVVKTGLIGTRYPIGGWSRWRRSLSRDVKRYCECGVSRFSRDYVIIGARFADEAETK